MNRRELLALIGGAAALAPFRATAQPGLPVIGYLSSRSAEAETTRRTGFLDGLEQQGFVVGQNIAIEYRYAEGQPDRLPALAAELVGLPAALLVATGAPAAVAAKKVTATIPHGGNDDEVEKAFATMAERQVRGLLYGASEYFQVIADKLIALAARYRIPASYEWREFVAAGGLMSYNVKRGEIRGLIGDYAGRILKGAAPADLPVIQISTL
jgi:ABC-type uncharacterized transport system substrate-binding protein